MFAAARPWLVILSVLVASTAFASSWWFSASQMGGTPVDVTPPAVPTGLTPTSGSTQVGLAWSHSDPPDVDEYVVEYRCPSGSGGYTEFSRPTSASATVTGLTNDVECDFRVAAEDVLNNQSAFTTAVQSTPMAGGGGSYTVYDNYALNIHNCVDPLCADPATNGVLFADGFEDGVFIDAEDANGCTGTIGSTPLTNDGWSFDSVALPAGSGNEYYDCADYGVNANWKFAHYRASATTIDTTVGNYGVAGSRGVMSLGYRGHRSLTGESGSRYPAKMAAAWHNIVIENDDPLDQATADGPKHYYFRYYVSIKNEQSMMCDCNATGSWDCPTDAIPTAGACPALDFASDSANGVKGWEHQTALQGSGLMGNTMGRDFRVSNDSTGWALPCQDAFADTGDDENRFHYQQLQNQGNDVRTNTAGNAAKWWAVQGEVQESSTPTAEDGYVRVWIDDCGLDGLGCSGTPTLRTYYTGLDNHYDWDTGSCDEQRGLKTIWWNWWEGTDGFGNYNGEYQFDEIIFVNGSVRGANNPIPFVPNVTGLTVTP